MARVFKKSPKKEENNSQVKKKVVVSAVLGNVTGIYKRAHEVTRRSHGGACSLRMMRASRLIVSVSSFTCSRSID